MFYELHQNFKTLSISSVCLYVRFWLQFKGKVTLKGHIT